MATMIIQNNPNQVYEKTYKEPVSWKQQFLVKTVNKESMELKNGIEKYFSPTLQNFMAYISEDLDYCTPKLRVSADQPQG